MLSEHGRNYPNLVCGAYVGHCTAFIFNHQILPYVFTLLVVTAIDSELLSWHRSGTLGTQRAARRSLTGSARDRSRPLHARLIYRVSRYLDYPPCRVRCTGRSLHAKRARHITLAT